MGKTLEEVWQEFKSNWNDWNSNRVHYFIGEMDKAIEFEKEVAKGPREFFETLEQYKAEGNYKLEISAYRKDKFWTLKAYHKDGHSKSCTTSAESLIELITLAKEKDNATLKT